jgi:hypothetical protein
MSYTKSRVLQVMHPDAAAFEAWWNEGIPTPPRPEIGLYPSRSITSRRIYYGPGNRNTAWAAYQAGIERMKAVIASGASSPAHQEEG